MGKSDTDKRELNWVPVLPDLFTITEDGARLLSARCGSCGTYFFPMYHQQHRPGCSREGIQNVSLSKEGKLSSFTIQHYMPPPPFRIDQDISEYAVGLVQFQEGIEVAGIVTDCPFDELKIGMSMETTTFTLYRNDEDKDVITWAYRPAKR